MKLYVTSKEFSEMKKLAHKCSRTEPFDESSWLRGLKEMEIVPPHLPIEAEVVVLRGVTSIPQRWFS